MFVIHFSGAGGAISDETGSDTGFGTIGSPCSDNRAGILCAHCKPGYDEQSGVECVVCPDSGGSWALLLAVDRRIPDNVADLRAGKWNKKEYSKARGLHGQTLGVLGAGNIAAEVIKRAAAFGMRALHVDGQDVEAVHLADVSLDRHALETAGPEAGTACGQRGEYRGVATPERIDGGEMRYDQRGHGARWVMVRWFRFQAAGLTSGLVSGCCAVAQKS